MKKTLILICCGLALIAVSAFRFSSAKTEPVTAETALDPVEPENIDPASIDQRMIRDVAFEMEILVDGRPLEEYVARGTTYVEALAGAEYEVRVRNPLPYRVAVALSVDGLNTIDARHTSAWNASKWVIEPYGTINISGWQMSSERARRFYFTSERDSYRAKLGQTANLGIISAVFFRERRPIPVPISPPPRPLPRRIYEEDGRLNKESEAPSSSTGDSAGNESSESKSRARASNDTFKNAQPSAQPMPDDEYAATGIGRS